MFALKPPLCHTPIEEFCRVFDFKRQYEAQTTLLQKTGLVETGQVLFLTGVDGNLYVLPSYETIVQQMEAKRELLETKADQGFRKLLLVPFGMHLGTMITALESYLIDYKQTHMSFGLDPNQPVLVWDGYDKADVDGTLLYDPISFDASHAGVTKADILLSQKNNKNTAAGWRVLLLQAGQGGKGFRGIPRSGKGRTVGKRVPRADIEAGKTAREYLSEQGRHASNPVSAYHAEFGMTPEEWIVLFMSHLEETGSPLDDLLRGSDSIAYLTGSYMSVLDSVPFAVWIRDDQQVLLLKRDLNNLADGGSGVRTAVRV